jgi:hypothetical protein
VQAGDDVQKSRLARAVCSDKGKDLSGPDMERNPPQDLDFTKKSIDVLDLQHK